MSATERGGDGMPARVARLGFYRRAIFVRGLEVVIFIDESGTLMLVRGWTVVVIRVIVFEVLVDVRRRRPGRRQDQGLNQDKGDEPAHQDSLPEAGDGQASPVCHG